MIETVNVNMMDNCLATTDYGLHTTDQQQIIKTVRNKFLFVHVEILKLIKLLSLGSSKDQSLCGIKAERQEKSSGPVFRAIK